MTKSEIRDLHPRVAYWLTQQGMLYLHEYRVGGGRIDFVAIDPLSGRVSIIECKIYIDSAIGPTYQLESYCGRFGIKDVRKIIFSYEPVLDAHRQSIEGKGFELFVTGDDAPMMDVANRRETRVAFDEVFEAHYGMTLYDLSHRLPSGRSFFDYDDEEDEDNIPRVNPSVMAMMGRMVQSGRKS